MQGGIRFSKSSIGFSLCYLALKNHHRLACATSHQQSRYQFRSAAHTKLYEDVPQMKLHRLLTDVQPAANLRVSQTFNTAKRHLRLAPTEVVVGNYAPDCPLQIVIPFLDCGLG